MTHSADVVIIGGGVIGASAAYHLAVKGCTNVIVLDHAAQPGHGSTGKATGGFRLQFGTDANVRLSLLSRTKLQRFKEEHGIDPGYRQCGYLFLADHIDQLNALRTAQKVQRDAGVPEVEELTADDVRRLNPAVHMDGILGGMFCPTDGFIEPMSILHGYMESAQRFGVRFEFNVECAGFTLNRSKIVETLTSQGTYISGNIVNAAGAWAGMVARYAGIDIPVRPLKRQVAVTYPTDLLPEDMPMTIFTCDGFHLRVRDGRVLLLLPVDLPSSDPFDSAFDDRWLEGVVARAHERVPCLTAASIDRAACYAGLYEMSPDKHVLLGNAPGLENLYLANGSSGHGVMHAPALGHLLAEIILDGTASTLNIDALRPNRFAEDKPNVSSEFL